MRLESIFAYVLVAIFALPSDTYASATWTVTASGTVAHGSNGYGMLPGLGADLTDMRFTQTITVSADPTDYLGIDKNADYSLMLGHVAGFTDTITLDGHVFTFSVGLGDGYQELAMGAANHSVSNSYDTVITQNSGDLIGNRIRAIIAVTATDLSSNFVPSLDFQKSLYLSLGSSMQGVASFGYFSSSGVMLVQFSGKPDTLVVNNGKPLATVPEPSSIFLVGLGCVTYGALRRRK